MCSWRCEQGGVAACRGVVNKAVLPCVHGVVNKAVLPYVYGIVNKAVLQRVVAL